MRTLERIVELYIERISLKEILILSAILAILLFCSVKYVFSNEEIDKDYSNEYGTTTAKATCVKVVDSCPNVRSEPAANTDPSAFGETNSFGKTKECNFTLEVSEVYTMDESLDANGKYIGLKVSDILDTLEGKTWFPKGIESDPDDIVWINEKYIRVL